MGTSGSWKSGQGDGHAANGRGADVRHAPEAQRQYAAFPRRDAPGQGPLQVSGVVCGQADGRTADGVSGHGLLSGCGLS